MSNIVTTSLIVLALAAPFAAEAKKVKAGAPKRKPPAQGRAACRSDGEQEPRQAVRSIWWEGSSVSRARSLSSRE